MRLVINSVSLRRHKIYESLSRHQAKLLEGASAACECGPAWCAALLPQYLELADEQWSKARATNSHTKHRRFQPDEHLPEYAHFAPGKHASAAQRSGH